MLWLFTVGYLFWITFNIPAKKNNPTIPILVSAEPRASWDNQASVKGKLHQRLNLDRGF